MASEPRHLLRADFPHEFVEGVRVKRGSDGRAFKLCSVCEGTRNMRVHHGGEPLAKSAKDPHPFELGGGFKLGKDGRHLALCARPGCGGVASLIAHSPKANGVSVGAAQIIHPERGKGRARVAQGAPTARATSRARAASLPPAEYVALAIAIDQVLALPPEAIGWRLRIRLGDMRPLLGVPDYPTLQAREAPPDPEAPTPADIAVSPERYASKSLPVAVDSKLPGILRGIQSGRHRDLVRRAKDQGWGVAMTGSGHVALTKGQSRLLVSTTVREGRGHGWANLRAEAKRAGIDVAGL